MAELNFGTKYQDETGLWRDKQSGQLSTDGSNIGIGGTVSDNIPMETAETLAWFAVIFVKLYIWFIKSGILLGILVGALVSETIGVPYSQITKTSYTSNIAAWLITTAAGFAVFLTAWHKKKKILLFAMAAFCIPGLISGALTNYGVTSNASVLTTQIVIIKADKTPMIDDPFYSKYKMHEFEKGTSISITGEIREKWVPVIYNNNRGWVQMQDINIYYVSPEQTPNAIVTADSIEVRSNLSSSSKTLNTLAKGAEITVLGVHTRYPAWAQIIIDEKRGWVETKYIQMRK